MPKHEPEMCEKPSNEGFLIKRNHKGLTCTCIMHGGGDMKTLKTNYRPLYNFALYELKSKNPTRRRD